MKGSHVEDKGRSKTRRNIYLPDAVWARVNTKAAERSAMEGEHVSASQIVRQALREFLAKDGS